MYDRTALIENSYPTDFGVQHHFSDNVYAKELHLPKGHVALAHKHSYSHISILGAGKCLLSRIIDGKTVETKHSAPDAINIPAGVEHQVLALEDVTWYCIHATKETDPEKIDKVALANASD